MVLGSNRTSTTNTPHILGILLFGLYVLTILSAPVYSEFFDGPILNDQRYFLAVLVTAIGGAVVFGTILRTRVRKHVFGNSNTSFWNELILYALTFVPVVIIVTLLFGLVTTVTSGELDVPLILYYVLATIATVTLLVHHRRGRVTYPDWLQANSWGVRDYTALFGGVFLLTYTYMSPAFGPTGGPLALFALICATIAVLLRRAGVFVSYPQ